MLNAKSRFALQLRGPARLEHAGLPLALSRKGLALLYVLALDGPTRRERLADLLWGHGAAANNLRVELHKLRRAFGEHGIVVFEDPIDPLSLPNEISLSATGSAEVMEGLEDLSPEFTEWLEVQRASQPIDSDAPPHDDGAPLDERIYRLLPPFVIVVRVRPGSSAAPLALNVAARLRLPYVQGIRPLGPAVHLLDAEESPELWRTVADDNVGVWVLESRRLGEDPPLLLTLRSRLPAERLIYVDLPPIGWWEARQTHLARLPFEVAAKAYLASGGHRGYLSELEAMSSEAVADWCTEAPVPQRVRAAYLLEAQKLSAGARVALDRLAVLPGRYGRAHLQWAGATPHLDELESRGWLEWRESWYFSNGAARTVLYSSLQKGRRQRYEEEARASFAPTPIVSNPEPEPNFPGVAPGRGRPFTGWSSQPFGEQVTVRDDRFAIVRSCCTDEPSGIDLQLTSQPLLLKISGNVFAPGVGDSGNGLPFRLLPTSVREMPVLERIHSMVDERPNGEVDHWFYLERVGSLRLKCRLPEAVLDLRIALYFALKREADEAKGGRSRVMGTANESAAL